MCENSEMNVENIMKSLARLSEKDYVGEPVSQLEHGLQSAGLALKAGAKEHLVLASLLHDVGHWCQPDAPQMTGLGTKHHDKLGEDYLLGMGFQSKVAALVGAHVKAKRYLTATTVNYLSRLSEASLKTLEYQGGGMTDQEIAVFEASPEFEDSLRLRVWDESAKEPHAERPDLEYYRAILRRHCRVPLSDSQLRHWTEFGWLHIKDWYNEGESTSIKSATDELQAEPEIAGKWMKYFEEALDGGRSLCRVENFLRYDPTLAEILTGNANLNLLSVLMNGKATLFKEKLNFKLPGGQGYAAHQDAPAFTTFEQKFHVTLMLSIDRATKQNGCLEIAMTPRLNASLEMKEDFTLSDEIESSFEWQPIETRPGDLVVFDSYVPHRSSSNTSNFSRRALCATYNRASDGDFRSRYFAQKRKAFPPDIERKSDVHYESGIFNVGNPLSSVKQN